MAMYNEITVEAELLDAEYMITKNYELLENKPQINSVELMGNKSLEDLGINPDAEENIIDTVKINGAALTPDANKAIDITITTGTNNGTVKVNGTDVNVKGLKSAAYTESSAYDVSGAAATVQGNVDALAVVVSGKVDKVSGKGLSQNDYTNADKTKLAGIQAGAQVNTVTSVAGKTGAVTLNKSDVGLGNVDNTSDANKPVSNATQNALNLKADTSAVNTALAGKVDKVEGYGLSENDYTTAEKTKLAGISAEANKVEITPVVTEGTTLATISIDGVDTAIKGSDIDVDSSMSPTSENPVQNKVIYDALNNILPEETAEGNPISITDASGLSAKSCEVSFSPIQSGSGDPSPVNVRPISGRDSVNVVVTGKNLIDVSDRTITSQTTIATGILLKAGTYTVSTLQAKNNTNIVGYFRITSGGTTAISQITIPVNANTRISSTFTIEDDGTFSIICNGQSAGYNYSVSDIMLEEGNTATAYEPYNRQTHTATFPETVYGGKFDFVSGDGKSIIKKFTLGDKVWEKRNTASGKWRFVCLTFLNDAKFPTTSTKIGNYCTIYKEISADQTWIGTTGIALNPDGQLLICDLSIENVEDLMAIIVDQEYCYELATPTEITLTPENIALLKGNNTLWTDGDNIKLKYSADIKEWVLAQLQS